VYISCIWGGGGAKPHGRFEPQFFENNISDVITRFKFGDDRLRGLASAEGQFCHFPLTLMVVLTTLSHYRVSVWCF